MVCHSRNDAPVSEDISSTTDEDTEKEITLKATDIDQDNITYSVISEPSNGTVTISGSPQHILLLIITTEVTSTPWQ